MTILHKIVRSGSDFFKSFKSENKKQIVELEKLEKKIEELGQKEEKQERGFILDNKTFFRFWIIGLVIVFVAYISYQSLGILYLILASYIVSLAVEAIVSVFQKRLRHRGISILLAYFFLVLVLFGALGFIIPFLLNQLSSVVVLITGHMAEIQSTLETKSLMTIVNDVHRLPGAFKKLLLQSMGDPTLGSDIQNKLQENISQLVNLGRTYAGEIGTFAINFVGSFLNFIKEIAIVVTLAVLLSFQKDAVMKFIANLGGPKDYKFIYMKLERIYKKLGIWLKSQLFLCIFIGGMMYLSFWILSRFGLDLPNKLSLSLIGALTELIPYFGPLLGGFVAVVVAFIHFGWVGGLIVAAVIFLIQRLENNVFIPLLMNKTLGVNPVVIFISMILGSLVIGFIGVLLAVPIAVIITMFLDGKFEE